MSTIIVPKSTGNSLQWFPLPTGVSYKNVGMNAEVGYTSTGLAPTVLKGEPVEQGKIIDASRGDAYILQDAYFSFEFMDIG